VKLLKELNEKIIQKNSNAGSYKMGREYYLSNKVKHVALEMEDKGSYTETYVASTVEETRITQYKVETRFDNISGFIRYQCECNTHFSFYNSRTMCEHVVATLLKYLYEKEQIIKEKEMIKTNNLIKEITKNISSAPKAKLYLDIEIKYQQDSISDSRKSFVELKVGEDKLYVIKT
jgi:hypothetical protein